MGRIIQNALVTGGGGFIGTALIRRLLAEGIAVRNVDFVAPGISDPDLRHYPGSFLDHALVREAITGMDCVFHLAATGFSREANRNPHLDAQENILGTLQLLDCASEAQVGRVIFCSSGGTVYGPTDLNPIPETAPANPISAYGISKLTNEKYMRLYNAGSNGSVDGGGLSTLTLRVANPYGSGQNINKAQGALTTFCHRAIRNEPIEIWGDGTVERDYIDVRDVAEALLAGARAWEVSGTEINIGSGQGASLNELIALIAERLGRQPEVHYRQARRFDVPSNILDITRASDLLAWKPQVTLKQGVAELIVDLQKRCMQKNPARDLTPLQTARVRML